MKATSLFSIAAALLLPLAAPAQQLELHAFSDTASVRIDVGLPVASRNVVVHASIRDAGSGAALWEGELGQAASLTDSTAGVSHTVSGVHPRLWSPGSPALYRLIVQAGTLRDSIRFGFRRFEAKDGRLLLNGRPVFLRGNAINPPQRMVPDSLDTNPRFIADYVRYLKSIGVNIIRLTAPSQIWFDLCDELGMMVFQGHYGTPRGGSSTSPPAVPLQQSVQWYRESVIGPQANHPSIVVYALSNEQAAEEISYLQRGAKEIEAFLSAVWREQREYDPTRAYITNAGYGFGRSGEICDIHRYWGWYYNSVLSFYTLRDPQVCWRSPHANQPITLSENTGNYTAPDGSFNLVSGTKQPDSQLNWTGHAPTDEQPQRALRYQAWVAQQAIETSRRLRRIDGHIAGLFPFTILFHNWWGIGNFADMKPKPVAEAYRTAYQPVLLSWELWTAQVYAGSTVRPIAHIVNDADDLTALRGAVLRYALRAADGSVALAGVLPVPEIPYYDVRAFPLSLALPASLATGRYTLAGELREDGRLLSRNQTSLSITAAAARDERMSLGRRVRLHDPAGSTGEALRRLGIEVTAASLARLDPARDLLVIAPNGWDVSLERASPALQAFVEGGGRVLALAPPPANLEAAWLPSGLVARTEELDHPLVYPGGRPFRNGMAVNLERPGHPVFEGIDRDDLFLWSDPTQWTDTTPGFPGVYPVTAGFTLAEHPDLAHIAILANYDHGLEGLALAELFAGRGSVLVTGFGLVPRVGLDPVADRMLRNLVRYQASAEAHDPHPLITGAIEWGDYGSEQGVVSELYHGLLVHTEPRVPAGLEAEYPLRIDSTGFVTAGSAGGWNTRPSIAYVAHGRRPFGPYQFTLGGAVRPAPNTAAGEGEFWLRLAGERTVMLTALENPTDRELALECTVNGKTQRNVVPAGQTITVETAFPAAADRAAVRYRGDRRLVLLRTEFR